MSVNKRPKTPIAQKLIEYRNNFGFTQQKVADILGIKRSTYGYYEIDTCPPISILKKLANMYNISVDDIVGEYPAIGSAEPPHGKVLIAAQPEIEYGTTLTQQNADESELLMRYRILPAEQKAQIKEIVKKLADELGN